MELMIKKQISTSGNLWMGEETVSSGGPTKMVMVMHLYSAFSMWIYSNALHNTL